MDRVIDSEYYAVKYGEDWLYEKRPEREIEIVSCIEDADHSSYEQADRLAQLYGGKVKKVVTYIEDTEAYPE